MNELIEYFQNNLREDVVIYLHWRKRGETLITMDGRSSGYFYCDESMSHKIKKFIEEHGVVEGRVDLPMDSVDMAESFIRANVPDDFDISFRFEKNGPLLVQTIVPEYGINRHEIQVDEPIYEQILTISEAEQRDIQRWTQ